MRYRVRGAWPFPTDMLRYDDARGATLADQALIDTLSAGHLPAGVHGRYDVVLIAQRCTEPRWESFGWRVLP